MKLLNQLKYSVKFIFYWFSAKHRKGHGVHSPFMYNLITKVFNGKMLDEKLKQVYNTYNIYRKSSQTIEYAEIGAGSNYSKKKTIGELIRKSSINKKYGKLLYNMVKYFNCKNMLEIGGSVGISSAFIAQAGKENNFVSIEGVSEKLFIANEIASQLNQNTKFVQGNFDDKLEPVLNNFHNLDFVFFDGNHTKEATLKYFNLCLSKMHNETVFVFDDIHWSKPMEEAWEEIKNNNQVSVSVDLFRMGLIFFKKELSNQHYRIKF